MKKSFIQTLQSYALDKGFTDAEIVYTSNTSTSVEVREQAVKETTYHHNHRLHFRGIKGQRQNTFTSNSLSLPDLQSKIDYTYDSLDFLTDNPYLSILKPHEIVSPQPNQRTPDSVDLSLGDMTKEALHLESLAIGKPNIKQAYSTSVSQTKGSMLFSSTSGVTLESNSTNYTKITSLIAEGVNQKMEQGSDYDTSTHWNTLASNEQIAANAIHEACFLLDSVQPTTGKYTVVFKDSVIKQFLTHFLHFINGDSIVNQTSLLKNKLQESVFHRSIHIIDSPIFAHGLAFNSNDREGYPCLPLSLVEGGVLKNWLLNASVAKQLGLVSNGRSSFGALPSIQHTHMVVSGGNLTNQALLKQVNSGIYVSSVMGMHAGFNQTTGDFSITASGKFIRGGELAESISNFSIAGNILNVFKNLQVGSENLRKRGSLFVSDAIVGELVIAGQ